MIIRGLHFQDNRRYPRVEYRSRIDVVCDGQLLSPVPSTTNLSEDGVQLQGVKLTLGQELKLFVMLPALSEQTARLVPVSGEVIWAKNRAAGIHFTSLPPACAGPLRQFVQEHLPA